MLIISSLLFYGFFIFFAILGRILRHRWNEDHYCEDEGYSNLAVICGLISFVLIVFALAAHLTKVYGG